MNINKFCNENNINIINIIDIYNNYFYNINKDYLELYLQIKKKISIIFKDNNINYIYNDNFNGMSIRYIKNNFTYFISNNNIYNYNYFIKKLNKNSYISDINYTNNIKKYSIKIFKKILYEKIIFIIVSLYKYIKNKYRNINKINIKVNFYKNIILIINDINNINFDKNIYIIINIFIIIENKKLLYIYSKNFKFNKLNLHHLMIKYIIKYIDNSIYLFIKNIYKKYTTFNLNKTTVILGPGQPSLIIHYIIGHLLEIDFVNNNTSIFKNKINKKIASSICNIVDNCKFKNYPKYINIDDEGIENNENILIKNGILKNFIFDKYNSIKKNIILKGNGRRQSYNYIPMPRITNICLLPGKSKPNDIINSVNYGIYINELSDKNIYIKNNDFIFYILYGYIIKDGLLYKPIKNFYIKGNIINTMKNISMIGNDFKLNLNNYICNKNKQIVHVGMGQSTIKINELLIDY